MEGGIFHATDIRGRYPKDVNERVFFEIGYALGKMFKKKFIVAADGRLSSPALYAALLAGLKSANNKKLKVLPMGLVTTPMFYFLVNDFGAAGGAMITASHNPKEDNGVKLTGPKAVMIRPAVLKEQMDKLKFPSYPFFVSAQHKLEPNQLAYARYSTFLKKQLKLKRPLTVVFDCSNGPVSFVLKEVLNRLPARSGLTPIFLNDVLDGAFPAHGPNPSFKEALSDCAHEVVFRRADLGMVFDGDADRVVFLDEAGEKISSDAVITLFSNVVGGSVVVDLLAGGLVRGYIANQKRRLIEARVGAAFIKEAIRAEKAGLGGEASGHYYFKKFFGVDGALFAGLMMINSVSRLSSGIRPWLATLPAFYRSGEINFTVSGQAAKQAVIVKLEELYHAKAATASHADGLKMEFSEPWWWFNVRPSNNEDLLRLNVEAKTEAVLLEKVAELSKAIGYPRH